MGYGKLQEVAQRGGCQNGSTKSSGYKKKLFSKMIVDHMECQNKCFWRVLSPWCSVLPLLKAQKALKMGCFGTKNGSKMCFSKNDPRPFGVPKQVNCALFEPIASHFGPAKVRKYLENGLFCGQKLGQKWVKNVFCQRYFWTIWGAQISEMSPF